MTHVWMFSPSSKPYLQRCIAAAKSQETDNKWTRKFGRINANLSNNSDTPQDKTADAVIEIAPSPEEQDKKDLSETYEEFFDSIENEIRLDIIAKECSKNPDLLLKMSQRLSTNTVEKLFNHIFTTKDVENSFLTALFHKFLPAYIKQQFSWLCIDFLTKINEIYPELFQNLLKILLEDIEVPNHVLNNYVSTLSDEKHTKFIDNLTNIELSSETFVHNILTIYTAYKDCTKSDKIQDYIRTNLIQHSKSGSSDRNYGRLFLSYLQAEKSLENRVNVKQLEECLEVHRSPFQRPCVMMLKEFVENE